ncbi:MAG: response regulator transcription factor [Propionibacteriaceae bacterium]|jgi:DNA-binding NarL/FixJ family response regulator|nr:response regulator transcription factor [Propionibacteriaceae bacterium]
MKLLVVDDNPIIRAGLAAKLRTFGHVSQVQTAGDGKEALRMLRKEQFDLVILDINMPKLDGIATLNYIKETPVVMLTSHSDEKLMRAALAAGARGYLTYGSFTDSELVAALLVAPKGGTVLGTKASGSVDFTKIVMKGHESAALERYNLSLREAEILDALARGLSNRAIAEELHISPQTVKTHLYRIYSKLGVSSRGQATAMWLGLLLED